MSRFSGGNDAFNDPLFTHPFSSMFESSFFGSISSPFMDPSAGFLEHHPPQPSRSNRPIIEELNFDDENEGNYNGKNKNNNLHEIASIWCNLLIVRIFLRFQMDKMV